MKSPSLQIDWIGYMFVMVGTGAVSKPEFINYKKYFSPAFLRKNAQ